VKAGAERWATPEAWTRKMNHGDILATLREHTPRETGKA
jgi:hypothetical protein